MKSGNLIFLGWNAYGDFLSYNGMVRFLLNYFDKIYIKSDSKFIEYLKDLYNDVLDRVIFVSIDEAIELCDKNINVLNTIHHIDYNFTSLVNRDEFDNISLKNLVPSEFYFNNENKISDFLDLKSEHIESSLEYIDNASYFYINIGLNPEIRYKFFYYNRIDDCENSLYNSLISNNNISLEDDYNVICETSCFRIRDEYKNSKYINIDYCTSNPLRLLKLLKKSKEIHLIENSHVLFLYYSHMSGLVKFDNVTIHIYSRNRLEYYYKMFMNPKIESWKIIF